MKNLNYDKRYAPYEHFWRNVWCPHCREFELLRPLLYSPNNNSIFEIITDSFDSLIFKNILKQPNRKRTWKRRKLPGSEMMGCVSFSHEECFGVRV